MQKLLSVTCLLFLATFSGMCPAQQDAGPPPTQVAPVPTMKQAQDFFLVNVASHAMPQDCVLGYEPDRKTKLTVGIGGDKLTIQRDSALDSSGLVAKSSRTVAAFLSDVEVSLSSQNLVGPDGTVYACKYPTHLSFECKTGKCFQGRYIYHSTWDNKRSDKDENIASESDSIYVDDAAMGGRLLKAVRFYQNTLSSLPPSPF